jgi:hypothetical protein
LLCTEPLRKKKRDPDANHCARAIINASFGRLSWISFTMVQIVEFGRRSNGRIVAPRSLDFVTVMSLD